MRLRRLISAFTLWCVLPAAAAAQDTKAKAETKVKKEMPPGWKMRLDSAAADPATFEFWTMPPGWHITTGPSAIVYDPRNTAGGEYRVESESFLFPGEHLEGYGVFFGGRDLDKESQSYSYFLLRKDGKFLVKVRDASQTRIEVPWTEHAAIVKHDGSKQTAKNVLAIEAGAANVTFFVNGQQVAAVPRAQLRTEGVVGLRVNHGVNVHITDLKIAPKPVS